MKMSFGPSYSETQKGVSAVVRSELHTIKKLRSGWLVYETKSGKMFGIFPTKLRAYYVASRLNGMVGDFFNFGTSMFGGKD